MAWKPGSEQGLIAPNSSIKNTSPGAMAGTDHSSTRLTDLGREADFSEAWDRGFSASSRLFTSRLLLHRSRMIVP